MAPSSDRAGGGEGDLGEGLCGFCGSAVGSGLPDESKTVAWPFNTWTLLIVSVSDRVGSAGGSVGYMLNTRWSLASYPASMWECFAGVFGCGEAVSACVRLSCTGCARWRVAWLWMVRSATA